MRAKIKSKDRIVAVSHFFWVGLVILTACLSPKEQCSQYYSEETLQETCLLGPLALENCRQREAAGLTTPELCSESINKTFLVGCLIYLDRKDKCSREIDW
jgi:hypothetical protein